MIGVLIAAVLLPPLGVYLVRGLRSEFWIAVALTIFGWVPGIIYGLITVNRTRLANAV